MLVPLATASGGHPYADLSSLFRKRLGTSFPSAELWEALKRSLVRNARESPTTPVSFARFFCSKMLFKTQKGVGLALSMAKLLPLSVSVTKTFI